MKKGFDSISAIFNENGSHLYFGYLFSRYPENR